MAHKLISLLVLLVLLLSVSVALKSPKKLHSRSIQKDSVSTNSSLFNATWIVVPFPSVNNNNNVNGTIFHNGSRYDNQTIINGNSTANPNSVYVNQSASVYYFRIDGVPIISLKNSSNSSSSSLFLINEFFFVVLQYPSSFIVPTYEASFSPQISNNIIWRGSGSWSQTTIGSFLHFPSQVFSFNNTNQLTINNNTTYHNNTNINSTISIYVKVDYSGYFQKPLYALVAVPFYLNSQKNSSFTQDIFTVSPNTVKILVSNSSLNFNNLDSFSYDVCNGSFKNFAKTASIYTYWPVGTPLSNSSNYSKSLISPLSFNNYVLVNNPMNISTDYNSNYIATPIVTSLLQAPTYTILINNWNSFPQNTWANATWRINHWSHSSTNSVPYANSALSLFQYNRDLFFTIQVSNIQCFKNASYVIYVSNSSEINFPWGQSCWMTNNPNLGLVIYPNFITVNNDSSSATITMKFTNWYSGYFTQNFKTLSLVANTSCGPVSFLPTIIPINGSGFISVDKSPVHPPIDPNDHSHSEEIKHIVLVWPIIVPSIICVLLCLFVAFLVYRNYYAMNNLKKMLKLSPEQERLLTVF